MDQIINGLEELLRQLSALKARAESDVDDMADSENNDIFKRAIISRLDRKLAEASEALAVIRRALPRI